MAMKLHPCRSETNAQRILVWASNIYTYIYIYIYVYIKGQFAFFPAFGKSNLLESCSLLQANNRQGNQPGKNQATVKAIFSMELLRGAGPKMQGS